MKKLKVAHIITRMIIGGAQENTLYTVIGLQADPRFEVTLISGPSLGPEGGLLAEMGASVVPVKEISFLRRELNPVFDLLALWQLVKILKKEKFDIVHTHSAKAGILGRLAAKICGVPHIIHTIHGLPFHHYESFIKNKVYIFLERWVSRYTDKIITVCDEMIRQSLEAKIAPPDKFQTIYSGLDVASFLKPQTEAARALRKKLGLPEGAFVIGKIGRLFHLKGHEYLLEAAKKVIEKESNAYFLLVGGGVLKEKLADQVKQLGIEHNVIFTGLISPGNIPLFLRVMDLVVHVSLREGLPRVIPQAFLSERAVVAFDIDGARDIIRDGESGYLVAPTNTAELAARILDLIQNTPRRNQFAQAGKTFALAHFSKEKMVREIVALYEEIGQVL